MEALLEFLHDSRIPVSGIRVGPVHRKDVVRASVMLERKKKEFAVILAFDVVITKEAKQEADQLGVKIFESNVIYQLTDMFTKYLESLHTEGKQKAKEVAVFPCLLTLLPEFIFNKRSPIIIGVRVEAGILKVGTPLVIPSKEFIEIGKVTSLEKDHKPVDEAKVGDEVCIEITQPEDKQQYMVGRHFTHEDQLVSHMTSDSLKALKEWFPEICTEPDIFKFLLKLKKLFNI